MKVKLEHPGPWTDTGHDGKTKVVVESQWGEVCRALPNNAKLIAAAPELLKALEICADWFCLRSNGVENGMQLEPGDVARIVKSAISKATT